jgi:RsmE family RNA methyltransferase
MNLILFSSAERQRTLAADDPRARHVREVLRMGVGDRFDVGVVDGPRGKARIVAADAEGLRLELEWGEAPAAPFPITLLVALARPQTCRKILRECTALGVKRILFFTARKGMPGYAESRLWSSGEWRRILRQGAEQAFTTHLPRVERFAGGLAEALRDLDASGSVGRVVRARLALDLYEATAPLSAVSGPWQGETLLAVGPEGGWAPEERDLLREAGFRLVHLGERVLRTETACVAAVTMTAMLRGDL